ncbi:armadillo repeat-containing protein 5 [Anas platyrhynchos]|uniref:armadillo repeat-containing protein 5 n=1 Tax=Anas platyrhynchos TaxID=8839 RepID=UPI003AF2334F
MGPGTTTPSPPRAPFPLLPVPPHHGGAPGLVRGGFEERGRAGPRPGLEVPAEPPQPQPGRGRGVQGPGGLGPLLELLRDPPLQEFGGGGGGGKEPGPGPQRPGESLHGARVQEAGPEPRGGAAARGPAGGARPRERAEPGGQSPGQHGPGARGSPRRPAGGCGSPPGVPGVLLHHPEVLHSAARALRILASTPASRSALGRHGAVRALSLRLATMSPCHPATTSVARALRGLTDPPSSAEAAADLAPAFPVLASLASPAQNPRPPPGLGAPSPTLAPPAQLRPPLGAAGAVEAVTAEVAAILEANGGDDHHNEDNNGDNHGGLRLRRLGRRRPGPLPPLPRGRQPSPNSGGRGLGRLVEVDGGGRAVEAARPPGLGGLLLRPGGLGGHGEVGGGPRVGGGVRGRAEEEEEEEEVVVEAEGEEAEAASCDVPHDGGGRREDGGEGAAAGSLRGLKSWLLSESLSPPSSPLTLLLLLPPTPPPPFTPFGGFGPPPGNFGWGPLAPRNPRPPPLVPFGLRPRPQPLLGLRPRFFGAPPLPNGGCGPRPRAARLLPAPGCPPQIFWGPWCSTTSPPCCGHGWFWAWSPRRMKEVEAGGGGGEEEDGGRRKEGEAEGAGRGAAALHGGGGGGPLWGGGADPHAALRGPPARLACATALPLLARSPQKKTRPPRGPR